MNINSKEDFEIALNDEHCFVRREAVESEFFGPEHMEIALNDEDWEVRVAAVESEFFEAKHMEKVLNDEDWVVIIAAKLSNSHGYIRYLDEELIYTKVYN